MPHVDLNEGNNYMDASTSPEYVTQHEQFILMQDMERKESRKGYSQGVFLLLPEFVFVTNWAALPSLQPHCRVGVCGVRVCASIEVMISSWLESLSDAVICVISGTAVSVLLSSA
ncbi:hypothetical protein JHK87_018607 [Glycine soja]|nr:hypothetical protein JHK87_018607 [Glycine soja]